VLDRLAEYVKANGWSDSRILNTVAIIRGEMLRPSRWIGYTNRLHIVNVDIAGMLTNVLKNVIDISFPDLVVKCAKLTNALQ